MCFLAYSQALAINKCKNSCKQATMDTRMNRFGPIHLSFSMLRLGLQGQSSDASASLLNVSSKEKQERDKDVSEFSQQIMYSRRYYDDEFEYRHVILPKQLSKYVPNNRLLSEEEWRAIGVQQSPGWIHYMIHNPEPHILLFRREKDFQLKYPHGRPEG